MNDIDESFFLEKLCQHLDKIEKKFIMEKEESEDAFDRAGMKSKRS
jgi:hypothetical protein